MSRRADELNTTSFAMLGMLAIRPWSTYELAKHVDRSLRPMWPRARSNLFNEPKKLVAHGLAVATEETVGRRPRTVYTITPAGRRALRHWLGTPGEGPILEFEQLLKVFFADHGTKTDALNAVATIKQWAHDRNADEHCRRPQLHRRHRPVPRTSRRAQRRRTIPHRLRRHGQRVGRLGHHHHRDLARRSQPGRTRLDLHETARPTRPGPMTLQRCTRNDRGDDDRLLVPGTRRCVVGSS